MHYYTIKNLKSKKYVYWDGDATLLKQSDALNNGSYFYFTSGDATTSVEGAIVMKIHNLMTDKLMADFASWNASGIDWYAKVVTNDGQTGVAFGKSDEFGIGTGTQDCWNDYWGTGTSISSYWIDGGSLFEVQEVSLPTYEPNIADGAKFVLGNYQHTGNYVKAGDNLSRGTECDNYAYEFTFLKQANGSYKIYNSYLNKYVSSLPVTGGGQGQNAGYDVNVPLVESIDDAQEYEISAASQLGYVTIKSTQTNFPTGTEGRCYWHMGGNGIVRWSAEGSSASSFKLISPTDLETDWDKAIRSKVNDVVNCSGFIGGYGDVSQVQSALTAFNNATADSKVFAYVAVETAIKNARIEQPKAGKYYTIGSAKFEGKYIVEDYGNLRNNSNLLYSKSYGSNIVPALWQFEEATDKEGFFHLKAANSSKYARLTTWGDGESYMVDKDDRYLGYYKIYNRLDDGNYVNTDHAVNLRCYEVSKTTVDGTMHCGETGYGHTDTDEGKIKSWNLACDGNQFTITEVTSVPVSISVAKYATLHLPFAVNIPSGVRAFIGVKNDDDQIVLSELTGVIPAKTPVILAGEAGNYDFDINYDDQTAAPVNALSGTLVPYTIEDGISAYVLKNGTHGVGLYKVTSTTDNTIGANKAYFMQNTSGNEPASFSFNFSETTGIGEAAVNSDADNVYYDLNGRRVLYPVHGIFVKGNGQKVYIK